MTRVFIFYKNVSVAFLNLPFLWVRSCISIEDYTHCPAYTQTSLYIRLEGPQYFKYNFEDENDKECFSILIYKKYRKYTFNKHFYIKSLLCCFFDSFKSGKQYFCILSKSDFVYTKVKNVSNFNVFIELEIIIYLIIDKFNKEYSIFLPDQFFYQSF